MGVGHLRYILLIFYCKWSHHEVLCDIYIYIYTSLSCVEPYILAAYTHDQGNYIMNLSIEEKIKIKFHL